jgi:hypothetical protein
LYENCKEYDITPSPVKVVVALTGISIKVLTREAVSLNWKLTSCVIAVFAMVIPNTKNRISRNKFFMLTYFC